MIKYVFRDNDKILDNYFVLPGRLYDCTGIFNM